jgi:hypothetical protein
MIDPIFIDLMYFGSDFIGRQESECVMFGFLLSFSIGCQLFFLLRRKLILNNQ